MLPVMDQLIIEYQPIGFLQQFGEKVGEIVGLGKAHIVDRPIAGLTVSFPVRGKNRIYGKYGVDFKHNGEFAYVHYTGYHPLYPELKGLPITKALFYRPGSDRDERSGSKRGVIFPGFMEVLNENEGNETHLSDLDIPEDLSKRVKVRRNNTLAPYADANCDVYYDIILQKDGVEIPLGYVVGRSRKVRNMRHPHDKNAIHPYYTPFVESGASDEDRLVEFKKFRPFLNLREKDDEASIKLEKQVMDYILADLSSQGFLWAFYSNLRGEKQFDGSQFKQILNDFSPDIMSPAILAYFTRLSDLPSSRRGLTNGKHCIFDFAEGKPNLNLGPVEISELCRGLATEDLDVLSEYLNLDLPEETIKFLSSKLASAFLRDGFQKNAQTAREVIARLKSLVVR